MTEVPFTAATAADLVRLLRSERKCELLRAARNHVQEAFEINHDEAQNLRLREILKLLYDETEKTEAAQIKSGVNKR